MIVPLERQLLLFRKINALSATLDRLRIRLGCPYASHALLEPFRVCSANQLAICAASGRLLELPVKPVALSVMQEAIRM
jgi:hypothetical protein